jgi:hypothetical protein
MFDNWEGEYGFMKVNGEVGKRSEDMSDKF